MDAKFERVDEKSPDRCQGTTKFGQCYFKKLEGKQFCAMHGGANQVKAEERKSVHDYQLGQWKAKHDQFANSDKAKSLLGELGIMKMLLQQILNMCKCDNDLIIYHNKMLELNREITKTVVACQSVQEKNKDLVDKTTLFVICDIVLNLVTDYIKDQDELATLSEKLYESISAAVRGETPSGNAA